MNWGYSGMHLVWDLGRCSLSHSCETNSHGFGALNIYDYAKILQTVLKLTDLKHWPATSRRKSLV